MAGAEVMARMSRERALSPLNTHPPSRAGRFGGLVQLHRGIDGQEPSEQDIKWQMTAQGDSVPWQYLFLQQSDSFSHAGSWGPLAALPIEEAE